MISRLSKSSIVNKFAKSRSMLAGLPQYSTNFIAIAHAITPFISVYPWNAGFGTKYANPVTLPTGTGNSVAFNPAGTAIAVAHATTPFISVYPWAAGFGTKYANPVTLPTGTGTEVAFK